MESHSSFVLNDDLYSYLFEYISDIKNIKSTLLVSTPFSKIVFLSVKKITGIKKCNTTYIAKFINLEDLDDCIVEELRTGTYLPQRLRSCTIMTDSFTYIPYFNFYRKDYRINIKFNNTFILIRGDIYMAMGKNYDPVKITLQGISQINILNGRVGATIKKGYCNLSKKLKDSIIGALGRLLRNDNTWQLINYKSTLRNRTIFLPYLVPYIEEVNKKLSLFNFFKKDEILRFARLFNFYSKINVDNITDIDIVELDTMEITGNVCVKLLPESEYFDFDFL